MRKSRKFQISCWPRTNTVATRIRSNKLFDSTVEYINCSIISFLWAKNVTNTNKTVWVAIFIWRKTRRARSFLTCYVYILLPRRTGTIHKSKAKNSKRQAVFAFLNFMCSICLPKTFSSYMQVDFWMQFRWNDIWSDLDFATSCAGSLRPWITRLHGNYKIANNGWSWTKLTLL